MAWRLPVLCVCIRQLYNSSSSSHPQTVRRLHSVPETQVHCCKPPYTNTLQLLQCAVSILVYWLHQISLSISTLGLPLTHTHRHTHTQTHTTHTHTHTQSVFMYSQSKRSFQSLFISSPCWAFNLPNILSLSWSQIFCFSTSLFPPLAPSVLFVLYVSGLLNVASQTLFECNYMLFQGDTVWSKHKTVHCNSVPNMLDDILFWCNLDLVLFRGIFSCATKRGMRSVCHNSF